MKSTERYNFIKKDEKGNILKNIDTRMASELNELINNPDKHNLDTLEKELIKSLFRTDKIWGNEYLNVISYMLNTLRDGQDLKDFFKVGIKLWTSRDGYRDLFMVMRTTVGVLYIEAEGTTSEELLDNFTICNVRLKEATI